MKLFDILKQFKTIEPDAQFTAHSKAEILISPRPEQKTMRGVFAFLHIIETSAAVVLAGLFILVLTGSFSGTHSIAPIQYAVIDPTGLHAEAQAIDMQIQLANVNYPQATETAESVSPAITDGSTIATGTTMKFAAIGTPTASSTASSSDMQEAGASSTPSSSVSVDDALKQLSQ
jgi:hypothetical protein